LLKTANVEIIQNLKFENDSFIGIYVVPKLLRTEELCEEYILKRYHEIG
jgi:hypothetical protein